MKLLILPLALITIAGCVPSPQTVVSGNTSNINPEAPYIWSNKIFPKEVRVASNFVDGEVQAIEEMALAWDHSVDNKKKFFKFGERTTTTFNANKPDGIMGIYKVTSWPKELGENTKTALAVTQLFGRRYSIGTEYERVEVEHADIFMNYNISGNPSSDYHFDWDDSSPEKHGYDFRTVILHEMGHFLGLNHIPEWWQRPDEEKHLNDTDYRETSVMYPSIRSSEVKRIPKPKDIDVLKEKYIHTTTQPTSHRPQTSDNDPGKNVRIIIELRADGECLHTENNKVIKRHHWKK